jgi:hypothetical protein
MLLHLLSSSRFDVTAVSSDGSTPLHYFIRSFPDGPSSPAVGSTGAPAADGDANATNPVDRFSFAVRQLIMKGTDLPTPPPSDIVMNGWGGGLTNETWACTDPCLFITHYNNNNQQQGWTFGRRTRMGRRCYTGRACRARPPLCAGSRSRRSGPSTSTPPPSTPRLSLPPRSRATTGGGGVVILTRACVRVVGAVTGTRRCIWPRGWDRSRPCGRCSNWGSTTPSPPNTAPPSTSPDAPTTRYLTHLPTTTPNLHWLAISPPERRLAPGEEGQPPLTRHACGGW